MTRLYRIFLILAPITVSAATADAAQSLLRPASFPTTASDASFTTRMENAATGYEPYKDASPYIQMQLESEEKAFARELERMERQSMRDAQTMTTQQYCDKYPTDAARCPQTPDTTANTIAIGDRPASAPSKPTAPAAPSTGPGTAIPVSITAPSKPTPTPSKPAAPAATPSTPTNNRTHGMRCTPPARSNHYTNKILTTGKYESIDSAFEKAMITIFRKEGGCGYDPDDTGGYTCYGISSRNNPDVNMRTLTRGGAEDIAYDRYYTKYNIDKLPDSVRGDVLYAGWGSGPVTAINKFRTMLNLSKNGRVDDDLVAAAENYDGDLHNDFLDTVQQYYVAVSKRGKNAKFLKGWMNSIRLARENGCFVEPAAVLTR